MLSKDWVKGTLFAASIIACLTTACSLNVASSKLSSGDHVPLAGFPERVGVATIGGNLAARQDATSRLARGLVDLGFKVVANNWDVDKILGKGANGIDETIPEAIRRGLEERYGIKGLFVGELLQDKGSIVNETRLSLRFISVPTGKLIWSANVLGGGVRDLSGGVNVRAVSAVEKALNALKKDIYADPGSIIPRPAKQGIGQTSSVSQLEKRESGKSDQYIQR
jgi:hypothetical protein